MIIGLIGLIGSGKSTVANILVDDFNYTRVSFADSLKDAVSSIFGWDREMLQGDTEASRIWREQVDEYWSNVIQHPVTPRTILQQVGTTVFRDHFHKNIWVHSLMKKLSDPNKNYVISDVRFRNEVDVILLQQGQIWEVRRPPTPDWYNENFQTYESLSRCMEIYYPAVHRSEWDWRLAARNAIINNDGSVAELKHKIRQVLSANIMT